MVHVVARHAPTLAGVESPALPAHLGPAGGSGYARWLAATVDRFGPDVVRRWREPPEGWEFESWRARRRGARALLGEAS